MMRSTEARIPGDRQLLQKESIALRLCARERLCPDACWGTSESAETYSIAVEHAGTRLEYALP